ncbi:MAG TPA: hypothetical protein ENK00_01820 [Chromatiales bacterium]|nr:hypothetical protein [Chromatiales bacterium]
MTTQKPDDDLDVLIPDGEVVIGDEKVTVAEFTFCQSLALEPIVQPLIQDLKALFGGGDDAEASVSYQALASVFGRHADLLLHMITLSTGRTRDWVEALSDADGQLLTMTFWQVNKGFFTRRLVIEAMAGTAQDAADAASDGAASLRH